MRDILILLVVVAGVLATFRFPFVGVLLWAWFTVMTPHQLAYGVFGIPLNVIIAAATIGSAVMNGDIKNFRIDKVTVGLVMFSLWLWISQLNSLEPSISAEYFDRFIKTLVFAMVVIQLTNTRLRAHALLWVLVLGVGFFGAKGGLFTFLTLGQYRVQGIETTILEDNNHLGIAMATILPLMVYLREQSARPVTKRCLEAMLALTLVAILGTHSRGALISLLVFGGFFWLYSKQKLLISVGFIAVACIGLMFMPAAWTERMATIGSAGEDASFQGRVDAWLINIRFANDNPLTGAGLRIPYEPDIAKKVAPELAESAKAAHSIYFEILGGSGYVGLSIFLMTLGLAVITAMVSAKRRQGSSRGSGSWTGRFNYFAQISLLTFCVGGASVSMEMWDGYWLIIALIAATARIPDEGTVITRPQTRPSWRATARGLSAPRPRPAE